MKNLTLSVVLSVVLYGNSTPSFARNVQPGGKFGFDQDLRRETEEVREMAHRLQSDLNSLGSNARIRAELLEIDFDVARFNANAASRRYPIEKIRRDVERIRGEFLNVEREVHELSGFRSRFASW